MSRKRAVGDVNSKLVKKIKFGEFEQIKIELFLRLSEEAAEHVCSLLQEQGIETICLFLELNAKDFEKLGINKAGYLMALEKIQTKMKMFPQENRPIVLSDSNFPAKPPPESVTVPPAEPREIQTSPKLVPSPTRIATQQKEDVRSPPIVFPSSPPMQRNPTAIHLQPKTAPPADVNSFVPPIRHAADLVLNFFPNSQLCTAENKSIILMLANQWKEGSLSDKDFWNNIKTILGIQGHQQFILEYRNEDQKYKKK